MQFIPSNQLPTLADAARAYAAIGLAVLPLPPRQKYPPPSGWQNNIDQYRGLDFVRWHWDRNPNDNIGIPMGPNGLLAADLDQHNHNGNACQPGCGDDGLAWLRQQVADWPYPWHADMIVQQTGSGGFQFIWTLPNYADVQVIASIKGGAGKIANHVDLIHGNRYIVACPSIHPNGNPYRWAQWQRPFDFCIEPGDHLDAARLSCPGWLWVMLEDLIPAAPMVAASAHQRPQLPIVAVEQAARMDKRVTAWGRAKLDGAINDLLATAQGGRNDMLNAKVYNVARAAADCRISKSEAIHRFIRAATAIGLEAGEIPATIASAMRAGTSKRRLVTLPNQPLDLRALLAGRRINIHTGKIVEVAE